MSVKNQILTLIVTLKFKTVSVQQLWIFFGQIKVCKRRGEENIITDVFERYVKPLSRWRYVSRTFCRPIQYFIYPWRRLRTASIHRCMKLVCIKMFSGKCKNKEIKYLQVSAPVLNFWESANHRTNWIYALCRHLIKYLLISIIFGET